MRTYLDSNRSFVLSEKTMSPIRLKIFRVIVYENVLHNGKHLLRVGLSGGEVKSLSDHPRSYAETTLRNSWMLWNRLGFKIKPDHINFVNLKTTGQVFYFLYVQKVMLITYRHKTQIRSYLHTSGCCNVKLKVICTKHF